MKRTIIKRPVRTRRIRRDESGASAVEFAMVLPVFLLLFFGVLEYGWLMTQEITLTRAVAEGARAALREADAGKRAQAARDRTRALYDLVQTLSGTPLQDADIDISFSSAPARVTVRVAALPYTPLVGFIPDSLLPESLHATAVLTFPR